MNSTSRKPTASASGRWNEMPSGELQAKSLALAEEIADDMPKPHANISFSELGEVALFYGYLANTTGREEYTARTYDYLNEAISQVPENLSTAWLHEGFVGVAWSLAHLARMILDEDDADDCAAVDELLVDRLRMRPWSGYHDLMRGLTGLGVYALERVPEPLAIECLRHVLTRLEEAAEHTAQGTTWFTSPRLLPEWQERICPHGYYNLGLAHGVPGMIAMLAQACQVPEVAEPAIRLLDRAVRWLLANKFEDENGAYFPAWLADEVKPQRTRLAWCYGELGAATALLSAARSVRKQTWEDEALTILRSSARQQLSDSGVKDAGLCHGSAGNAHLFNRIFQATGEEVFKQAAVYWYERTFEFRMPGQGIAGFQAWQPTKEGEDWVTRAGLLEGAAGIGLALLAASTDIEPRWDRLLLVSIPPQINQR